MSYVKLNLFKVSVGWKEKHTMLFTYVPKEHQSCNASILAYLKSFYREMTVDDIKIYDFTRIEGNGVAVTTQGNAVYKGVIRFNGDSLLVITPIANFEFPFSYIKSIIDLNSLEIKQLESE